MAQQFQDSFVDRWPFISKFKNRLEKENGTMGELKVNTYKVSLDLGKVTFLHCSDLHNAIWLPKLAKLSLPEKVDLVFFTGDMGENNFLSFSAYLRKKYGDEIPFLAITGNHDFLIWKNHHKQPLEQENVFLTYWQNQNPNNLFCDNRVLNLTVNNQQYCVIGVKDLVPTEQTTKIDFTNANPDLPWIILLHRPPTHDFLEKLSLITTNHKLILSGHNHGGQIELPRWLSPTKCFQVKKHGQGLISPEGPWPDFDFGHYHIVNIDIIISPGMSNNFYLPKSRYEIGIINCK